MICFNNHFITRWFLCFQTLDTWAPQLLSPMLPNSWLTYAFLVSLVVQCTYIHALGAGPMNMRMIRRSRAFRRYHWPLPVLHRSESRLHLASWHRFSVLPVLELVSRVRMALSAEPLAGHQQRGWFVAGLSPVLLKSPDATRSFDVWLKHATDCRQMQCADLEKTDGLVLTKPYLSHNSHDLDLRWCDQFVDCLIRWTRWW